MPIASTGQLAIEFFSPEALALLECVMFADSELIPPAIPRNPRPEFRSDRAHHFD
jgi:hypothetical protein